MHCLADTLQAMQEDLDALQTSNIEFQENHDTLARNVFMCSNDVYKLYFCCIY